MPDDPTPPAAAPRRLSAQDKRIAERIPRVRQTVQRILEDPDAPALLAAEGWAEQRLRDVVKRCDDAQRAFDARLDADVAQDAASKAFKGQNTATRRAFRDLRGAVLSEYRDEETRRALGVLDEPKTDLEQFLTESRATVGRLGKEPHRTALATNHGYTTRRVEGVGAALDALEAADQAHAAAMGAAEAATQARDGAYGGLMAEWDRLRRTFPRAFRDHPAVRARLGL
jgi:hypothetical protein